MALKDLGLDHQIEPVNIFTRQQHEDAFCAVNPNGKVPAIEDRGEMLSWLMFVAIRLGPQSGQSINVKTARWRGRGGKPAVNDTAAPAVLPSNVS